MLNLIFHCSVGFFLIADSDTGDKSNVSTFFALLFGLAICV